MDPEGPVFEVAAGVVIHPRTWFEEFARHREPVVLRGAVAGAPGLTEWTDERLSDGEYGPLQVKLEGKREKRGEAMDALRGRLAAGRDTLGNFINRTRDGAVRDSPLGSTAPRGEGLSQLPSEAADAVSTSSMEGYVVSQLPQPMAKDVLVPAVASCGSMSRELLEANLWVSSGNTSSMLHRDADSVLNCVYRGSKTWTLINPVHTHRVPAAAEKEGELGGVALVDPDRIDASTPQGRAALRLPYRRATVRAGDCLFLPWGYWHQVYSPPGRNIAVSLLFSVPHNFSDDEGECDASAEADVGPSGEAGAPAAAAARRAGPAAEAEADGLRLPTANWLRPVPLPLADLLWTYDGLGAMSMGNADPKSLLVALMRLCLLPETAADLPAGAARQDVAAALRRADAARAAAAGAASRLGLHQDSEEAYGEEGADAEAFLEEDEAEDGDDEALRLAARPDRPNTWLGLVVGTPAADLAASVSRAMATALGVASPVDQDLPGAVRRLEARLGRPLSPREEAWARQEFGRVGVGVPLAWGGVLTKGRFLRRYTQELITMHARDDAEDEDGTDDTPEAVAEAARARALAGGAAPQQAEAAAARGRDVWFRRRAAREAAARALAAAAREEAEAMWATALDPIGRGFVTIEAIARVPRRAVASVLRVAVQFDPSNTDEWELYLQDGSAVTSLLLKHWATSRTATAALAGAQGQRGAAGDAEEALVDTFMEAAVAAGCGVLYAEPWRQSYLEALEGTDAIADRVVAVIVEASARECAPGMAAPPPLTRPKRPEEGGDPSLPVVVMVAVGEDAFEVALSDVAELFSRGLARDPALGDLDDLAFA